MTHNYRDETHIKVHFLKDLVFLVQKLFLMVALTLSLHPMDWRLLEAAKKNMHLRIVEC